MIHWKVSIFFMFIYKFTTTQNTKSINFKQCKVANHLQFWKDRCEDKLQYTFMLQKINDRLHVAKMWYMYMMEHMHEKKTVMMFSCLIWVFFLKVLCILWFFICNMGEIFYCTCSFEYSLIWFIMLSIFCWYTL